MQDPTAAAAPAFQPIKPQFPEQEQLKCPRCDSTNTKFCYYNNYNLSQPRHFCKNCRRYWTKGGALRNIPVGGGSRKNAKRSSSSCSSQKRSNPDPDRDRATRRVPESASPTSRKTATAAAAAAADETPKLMGEENSGSGQEPVLIYGLEGDPDRKVLDGGFSFSSLLSSNSQFGSIFDGLNSIGSGLNMVPMVGFVEDLNSVSHSGSGSRLCLDVQGGRENNKNKNKTTSGGGGGGGGNGGDNESYLQQGSSEWGNSNGWPDLAIYTPGSSYQSIEGKQKNYFV